MEDDRLVLFSLTLDLFSLVPRLGSPGLVYIRISPEYSFPRGGTLEFLRLGAIEITRRLPQITETTPSRGSALVSRGTPG